ncbi:MAG: hypothetical protein KatS3mg111_1943 [Pirellulaceae bacterium]|nr:MAG: hypothetical protein KatS3mg111_1943 [Pirellulaceae bacterium]
MLHRRKKRTGAATVELAIFLPLLVILTFGAIELTSLIYLKQRLLTAAYEAARIASGPRQTSTAAINTGMAVLSARGITNGSIAISPDPVTINTPSGTEISATASAPFAENASLPPFVLPNFDDVTVTVVMMRQ